MCDILCDEIAGDIGDGHLGRENECLAPLHHFSVGDLGVLGAEGREADQHLEHDHAQGPPVARATVSTLQKYLTENEKKLLNVR